MRNNINLFHEAIDQEEHVAEIVGKMNRYYAHGESIEAFSSKDQEFIKMVEEAHSMLIDFKNRGNKALVAKKLIALHNINNRDAYAYIKVATELFNVMEQQEPKYLRYMMIVRLEKLMEQCEKNKDHKNFQKYYDRYVEITKINKEEERDESQILLERNITFMPSKELLEVWHIEKKDIGEDLKKLESKARQIQYGRTE